MADTHKHSDKESHPHAGEKSHAKEHKAEPKGPAKEPKAAPKSAEPKPGVKEHKSTGAHRKTEEAKKRAAGKTPSASQKGAQAAKPRPKGEVTIVEKAAPKYQAQPKATLTQEQKHGLALRRSISNRRPWFRRQQWYEYKRLADSGWRKPTGVDSAQRRHFGYEQPVVRIGFGGPRSVRGLHPSGFREVYVEHVEDLQAMEKTTHAARVSGKLGARKLKLIYAEADKLGVRVLNRRKLE